MTGARILFVSVLLATAAVACSGGGDDDLRIGALLPLTGALQSNGEASRAALELAARAIDDGDGPGVELVIEDTATDPEQALEKLRGLYADGIRVVIGPYASSEVAAVKEFADDHEIVLVSPLSTARSLAVAGDHIFRFTPDDGKEGEALAAVALDDGITTIVPVSRDDAGNLGLQAAVRETFEPAGGTIAEGVTYAADEDDFGSVASEILAALGAAGSDPSETAVYLTAFGEVVDLFHAVAALDNEALTAVPWYGSDSVALSADLVADGEAASFAVEVGYPNPILGLRDEERRLWEPVVAELDDDLGRRPDSFALAAYDALVVAHRAMEEAGADAGAGEIGAALVEVADAHVGLTGPAVLNEAGDRASASFDFWAVCPDGDGHTWERTISYAVSAGGEATVRHSDC